MGSFFIDRPVFAWVVAIVTMLAGAWSMTTLPVSQYPDIAPTTIRISATYSGATAQAVENSVTRIIEDNMTGIDGLLYMMSTSSKGRMSIQMVFDESIEPVDAENDVQTRVSQIKSNLPSSVQSRGVTTSRSNDSILLVGSLVSTDGKYSPVDLGNILEEYIEDPVRRTSGVGGIQAMSSGYAMRIWLDPMSLARYQLTPSDVVSAVTAQNMTVSVGSLGSVPTVEGQQFTATMTAQSQLTDIPEFERILLKTTESGGVVYLSDVARLEIGQETYGMNSRYMGMPAAGFGVNLATGANAVDTSAAVRATIEKLKDSLPEGVEVQYAYDTAPFVELSIEQVYHTLGEAVVLVVLVLLVFLQSFRATFVPLIAVPVVLLGTLAVLAIAGYSINTLTMFAMVLAIGLLVDDAIVVVENVERLMDEGLKPLEATRQSMGEITSALVGIVVVLSAVFLPMAFFGGSTGVIYQQFSITIIAAMILSLLVAIILSPALCANFLVVKEKDGKFAPARWFNKGFAVFSETYGKIVRFVIKVPITILVVMALVCAGAWFVYERMNSSFLPTEDQGMLMASISLPQGSTYKQTQAVVKSIEDYINENEKESVEANFAVIGFNFTGTGQNNAMMFLGLRDFELRSDQKLSAAAVALRANMKYATSRKAQIFFMQPPAIMGLGNTSGFSLYLTAHGASTHAELSSAANQLVALANQDPRLQSVRATNNEDESALRINIDQQKAESLGVTVSSINTMLSIIFASSEVNDFVLEGNLRPVIVQADAQYRMQPDDIKSWYIRNTTGEMVPFSSFISTTWEPVAPSLSRFTGSSGIQIQGSAAHGVSSGQAMEAMEELATQIPGGYGVEWTGLSYQERESGQQAPMLYTLSVLIVFLALAALYESWSIPIAVMLVVPVGILGAVTAAWLFGQSNDVYFKVGILTTIGLSARNSILVVEFAESLYSEGVELAEAAVRASVLRLRPVMMTAFAFILGVLPLATATGAGANAQNAIGIGVIGGMITSTFIGMVMVPGLYVVVRRLFKRKPKAGTDEASASA